MKLCSKILYMSKYIKKIQEESSISLQSANSLWCQKDYPFLDSYITMAKEYIRTGVFSVDFKNNHVTILNNINAWIEKETGGKIQNILSPNMLNPLTLL